MVSKNPNKSTSKKKMSKEPIKEKNSYNKSKKSEGITKDTLV